MEEPRLVVPRQFRQLRAKKVQPLHLEEQVFSAMKDGWRAQMFARNLADETILMRGRLIQRFFEFSGEYPWTWGPEDHDSFLGELSGVHGGPASLTTRRAHSGTIADFCNYITDPSYGWPDLCMEEFDTAPIQIRTEWNRPVHSGDSPPPTQRNFTLKELHDLFGTIDDYVDAQYAQGKKGWRPAHRDSTAFKLALAFGLRRREVAMLDISDFGTNPYMDEYRSVGTVLVRWAKGSKGSGPRRRTVLTVPRFEWVVPVVESWLMDPRGRESFPMHHRSPALLPSERGDRVAIASLSASFRRFKRLAGLEGRRGMHGLRHSYTTVLVEEGYDPLFVQRQLGHEHASTTAIYTGVSRNYRQSELDRVMRLRAERFGEVRHG